MPCVSVVIPNYNHAAYLQQRIESVIHQTFEDFEVIILDDCSTDNSKTIIEQYRQHPKVEHIVYNETNGGSVFKQWQKGIQLAKGDYIWIAESDDWAALEFLSKLMPAFTHTNTGLAFCNSYQVDEYSNVLSEHLTIYPDNFKLPGSHDKIVWAGKNFISEYLIYNNVIPNASAVLFKAEALKRINFDDVRMRVAGDWYVYAAVLEHYDICGFFKPMNYFRSHQNSVRTKKKFISTDIVDMYCVLQKMMKILNINVNQLPQKQPYFLAEWYILSLCNTAVFTSNYFNLLKMFSKINPIERKLLKKALVQYARLFKYTLSQHLSK